MTPPPTSPARPTPNDLQSHLYASFLQRKTADVALRISGSWHAIYRLHRVILIQAGFFQSLFTSGFSESKPHLSSHRAGPDYIDIVFDDPNITRAAFELCIARLYGGGPPLWISPSLIPTATHPLTPPFASVERDISLSDTASLLPPGLDISSAPTLPPGHHPATPRFLLSLLATAVYLSIPSVASQALSAIVRTVGPHTAVRYLNFAIGRGIGPSHDLGTGNDGVDHESEAATGLEDVAELIKDDDPSASYESIDVIADLLPQQEDNRAAPTVNSSGTLRREGSKHSHSFDGPPDSDTDSENDAGADSDAGKDADARGRPETHPPEPCAYYGAVSDKVGEAAACWLARWGVDILRHEQQALASSEAEKSKDVIWSPGPREAQCAGDRPGSAPPEIPGSRFGGKGKAAGGKSVVAPILWRRGGLGARWVRGILSSDAFFVRGEKERYEIARSVVEMRRAARDDDESGESEGEEEAEFEKLFREGIYYANVHPDDLMAISRDVSPSTGKPFVPLPVLQAALWNQSTLQHHITFRPPGSASPSLSPAATKELGISVTAEEIRKLDLHPEERLKPFYPVPGDTSIRLGDSTGVEGASMDQLFELGASKKGELQPTEANFFGLERSYRLASSFATSSADPLSNDSAPDPEAKWTAHPPFRFAVEFWDVDALKEKIRLYSHTVWYAGSLYNVYVQVVRKKGVQLGIYLHRQSSVDPIPPSSAPVSGMLSAPPRDRSMLGRGASSSVSSPRPLSSLGSLGTSTSPSATESSMSPLARATSTIPSAPTTPVSASTSASGFISTTAYSRSSTPLHASSGSVGSIAMASPVMLPAAAPPVTPPQPYRDPRPKVSAYFTIACASATGASLTRFTSAPDTFTVHQSWGWKSSSLRTEEYLEVDADGQPKPVVLPAGREVSLRATVVLGVV
ncbi:hypothetical protein C8Q76DRAFT_288408 [Earliella scabrosa]|nr:hypothetical protein C8Q76DRAFT_288408 [Earliella scabrosa]